MLYPFFFGVKIKIAAVNNTEYGKLLLQPITKSMYTAESFDQ